MSDTPRTDAETLGNITVITKEAINTLRSEPVAWRYKLDGDLDWQYTTRGDVIKGLRLVEELYAAPSREDQRGSACTSGGSVTTTSAIADSHPTEQGGLR